LAAAAACALTRGSLSLLDRLPPPRRAHGLLGRTCRSRTAWSTVRAARRAPCGRRTRGHGGRRAALSHRIGRFYGVGDPRLAQSCESRSVGRVTAAHDPPRSRSVGRVTAAHPSRIETARNRHFGRRTVTECHFTPVGYLVGAVCGTQAQFATKNAFTRRLRRLLWACGPRWLAAGWFRVFLGSKLSENPTIRGPRRTPRRVGRSCHRRTRDRQKTVSVGRVTAALCQRRVADSVKPANPGVRSLSEKW
jgi:hypothetical protein